MNPGDTDFETKVTLEGSKTGVIEEPPFRMLVVGDWSADAGKKVFGERRVIEIDRDNFDDLIARLGVRLDLDMEGGGSLSLEFADLDDFHPDQIFRRVSLFSELRDLRRRLRDESSFHSAAREVRERLSVAALDTTTADTESAPAETPNPPSADNLLDAILSVPSGGAPPPRQGVSGELGNLINDLVRPHLVLVDEGEQSQMVAAVDAATGDLMRGILHHRKFRELEAAWRGLYFLIKRTETSTDLKLLLLDVSKSELADDLKSAGNLSETVLYRHLIRDTIETPGGEPWAVVCGNYAFGPNVDDVATLMRLGKLCAAANAPFIAHMRPDVLGVHSIAESPDNTKWKMSAETDAGKLWAALRGQSGAEYLGMTIPRFLSRLPYGSDTDPLETFLFEEFTDGPTHDLYTWSNSSFAASQLLAESFSEYGWEMGRALKQDIEGLPVHVFKDGGETVYKPCSEVLMTQEACEKLVEYGLMPLVSYKNTDRVKLARFQSIADPVTGLKGMWR